MATYFVSSAGTNTAPYDTWAKAATSLQTALTAASTNDDIVVIQYNGVPSVDAELAADTSYTLSAAIFLVAASNDGGSAWTETPMGAANWIGNSTSNRLVKFGGAFRFRHKGLSLRVSGGTNDNIELGTGTDGIHYEGEDTFFWIANGNAGCSVILGSSTSNHNGYVKLVRPTVKFGNAGQKIIINCDAEIEELFVDPTGSVPNDLFVFGASSTVGKFTGGDLSHATGNLVGNSSSTPAQAFFDRVTLGSGVEWLAAQSVANKSSAKVTIMDCSSGDVHGIFGYQDAFGKMSIDSGVYFTGTPGLASWKIVTSSNVSRYTPFVSPWISTFVDSVSIITPRLEVLRDLSTTAYTNADVWAEFLVKASSGLTKGTFYSDRAAFSATPSAQGTGAGTTAWTGNDVTSWSGKVDSGTSVTPAEAGDLSARVLFAVPSATVYVDTLIRV